MKTTIQLFILLFLGLSTQMAFAQYKPESHKGSCNISSKNLQVKTMNPISTPANFTMPPTSPPPPVPPPPSSTFERQIYFVHGLGGDNSTWDPVADAVEFGATGFPARKANTLSPTYTNQSLDGAANDLYDFMDASSANNGFDADYNFIISHSQGGLVSRAADRHQRNLSPSDKVFSGIVTFSTPHQGAQILNNTDLLIQIANQGCNNMLEGPIEEKLANAPFLTFLVNLFLSQDVADWTKEVLIQNFCGLITEEVLPILTGSFTSQITNDYNVGAPYLNQLNADEHESTLPKVAFYGVETEPVLWRQISSLTSQNPNNYEVFGATDKDDVWVMKSNDNIDEYQTKFLTWKSKVDNWSFGNWLDIKKSKNRAMRVRDAYRRGWHWWANANGRFKIAIGTTEIIETSGISGCECVMMSPSGEIMDVFSSEFGDMNADCTPVINWPSVSCNQTTYSEYTTIHYESDGVVTVPSATGYEDANSIAKMPGSNHQQARNDDNTCNKLLELFSGAHGSFFATAEQ